MQMILSIHIFAVLLSLPLVSLWAWCKK